MNRKVSISKRFDPFKLFYRLIPFVCLCVGMSTHATDAQGGWRVCQVPRAGVPASYEPTGVGTESQNLLFCRSSNHFQWLRHLCDPYYFS